jgi:hypothetical protein
LIINHNDCGLTKFTDDEMEERLRRGTGKSPIAPAKFYSFTDAEENTREQIQKARSHPWISPDVPSEASSSTSTRADSVKCSRTRDPSPPSKRAASVRLARHLVSARTKQEIKVCAGVGTLDVIHVETFPSSRG